MALSNFKPHPKLGDPPTTSSIQTSTPSIRPNGKSWAQIASRERKSLLHPSTQRSEGDDNSIQYVRSHIWKPGRSPGSMFFDVSACHITHQDIMVLIKAQYPSRIAVVPFSQGPKKIVEVNFNPSDANFSKALKEGIHVASANIQVIPCVAMDSKASESNIKRISLTRLPLLAETELLAGLKSSLEGYGTIIDLGIFREPKTQTYMGTGYAILVRQPDAKLATLTHTIPWLDSDTGFHATWTEMPPWCRYCHQEGHVVSDCPQSRRRQICWNCSELGHKAAMCPRGNYGKRIRKTSNPTHSTTDQHLSNNTYAALTVDNDDNRVEQQTSGSQQQSTAGSQQQATPVSPQQHTMSTNQPFRPNFIDNDLNEYIESALTQAGIPLDDTSSTVTQDNHDESMDEDTQEDTRPLPTNNTIDLPKDADDEATQLPDTPVVQAHYHDDHRHHPVSNTQANTNSTSSGSTAADKVQEHPSPQPESMIMVHEEVTQPSTMNQSAAHLHQTYSPDHTTERRQQPARAVGRPTHYFQ